MQTPETKGNQLPPGSQHPNKLQKQNLLNFKILHNSLFIVLLFQDIQLRIPPPQESYFLARRRKERGASLKDGKPLVNCIVITNTHTYAILLEEYLNKTKPFIDYN
ncbi:hypothetical protein Fmac_029639 [Flemingia macrophylla]|uniref:Uncharacterized protein n=1 Tax=Flemingia macrophylla TaxID=520843 RepID=A0ABD1LAV8_9FABA